MARATFAGSVAGPETDPAIVGVRRVLLLAILIGSCSVATATAQTGPPSATMRWVDVSGTCWTDSLDLQGSIRTELPAGADVRFSYDVANASGVADLGDAAVPATAPSHSTTPYVDGIWFGSRWVEGFPYTYVQDASTRLDGVEVFGQTLTALCTAPGAAAIITVTERPVPVPPGPVPAVPIPASPGFTG